jgi:hypothetical protein
MLCGAKEFQGYAIHARDGDLGKVRTYCFDEEEWRLHSIVVDTGAWFAGRHVGLATAIPDAEANDWAALGVHLHDESAVWVNHRTESTGEHDMDYTTQVRLNMPDRSGQVS